MIAPAWPAYLGLPLAELRRRAAAALQGLASCTACPRNCKVNRLENKTAACRSGRYARVASWFPHRGEEDCLRGWRGSGTIFFSWCNLRCVFCLHPDVRVLTERGMERVEDIFAAAGDELDEADGKVRRVANLRVWTRTGRLAPVAKAFSHPYRGEMVVLKPYGLPPLVVTPDHAVYATREPGGEARKVPAREVARGWLLFVPKPRGTDSLAVLDARALLLPHVGTFRRSMWRRVPGPLLLELAAANAARQLTTGQIAAQLGYHPAYVRGLLPRIRRGNAIEGPLLRNDLIEENGRVRFKTERGIGVPTRLTLGPSLARLLGYYCAEGRVATGPARPNSCRLIFSYGPHEVDLAQRTAALIAEVFGVEAALVRRRTTLAVEVRSTSVATLFKTLAGSRARHKRVPAILTVATTGTIRAFLEAHFEGDGYRGTSYLSANTVSEELALGLVALLLRLGVFPHFYPTRRQGEQTIEGRRVKQSPALYYVKCRRDAWEGTGIGPRVRHRETEDGFRVPIRRVSSSWYEGPVYNLEVADEDHSYIASGMAVGNCQNFDISQQGAGEETRPEALAHMMLALQGQGCHNINLVTPEHVVPQILEALPFAVEGGLQLPIVYNTGAYDALESLQLLDGIVDIYMPDFKFWDRELSLRYLRARDYPEVARAAIREMHRQVGDLVIGGDGLARRGLLVRHLVMPGGIAGTREIMRFLAEEMSKDTYVNVMDQYYPAGRVSRERFFEINRRITRAEYDEAVRAALEAGLHRLDQPRRLAPVI